MIRKTIFLIIIIICVYYQKGLSQSDVIRVKKWQLGINFDLRNFENYDFDYYMSRAHIINKYYCLFGMNLGYQITKRSLFLTGVKYYTYKEAISITYESFYNYHSSIIEYDTIVNKFLEPFLGWKFIFFEKGKFSFYFDAGMGLNFKSTKIYIDGYDVVRNTKYKFTKLYNFSLFYYQLYFGLCTDIKIYKSLSIIIQPYCNYGVNKYLKLEFNHPYYKDFLLAGIEIGLIYRM